MTFAAMAERTPVTPTRLLRTTRPTPGGDASDAALDGDASQDGLLARWTFDEDGGTTAHDVSGRGHDGLVLGGSWVAGKRGGALLLNGTSDYVAVPPSTDFDRPHGDFFPGAISPTPKWSPR